MKTLLIGVKRSRLFAALAGALAMAAFGSIAWASIPDSAGVIHGCYDTSTGALRVIDNTRGDACSTTEQGLDWQSSASPVLGARVAEDGRLLLGFGVTAVTHDGTGAYQVVFSANVGGCLIASGLNGHPGEISGEPDRRDETVVDISTFDSKGRPKDGTFYLAVTCPPA